MSNRCATFTAVENWVLEFSWLGERKITAVSDHYLSNLVR
jgi:hypothetical protein